MINMIYAGIVGFFIGYTVRELIGQYYMDKQAKRILRK